jgi:uncharacterized membrane protein
MSLPENKPKDSANPPGHVRFTLEIGRPGGVVLWAVFIFLMGAIAGGSVLYLIRPPHHRDGMGKSALPRDFSQMMRRDLNLSDEQTAAIEQIVRKYEPRLEQNRREARDQMRADLAEMNDEILPLLSESQREAHRRVWQKVIDNRPPRGPGPPREHGPPRRPPRERGDVH